jgi:hypothetical protein
VFEGVASLLDTSDLTNFDSKDSTE